MKTAQHVLHDYIINFKTIKDSLNCIEAMHTYAAQFQQEWVSVDDRLPDCYGYYLVSVNFVPHVTEYIITDKRFKAFNGLITHWQKIYLPCTEIQITPFDKVK